MSFEQFLAEFNAPTVLRFIKDAGSYFNHAYRFPLITEFFAFHKIIKLFKEICSAYK